MIVFLRHRLWVAGALVFSLFSASVGAASAQQTLATLSGRVASADGASIGGAVISVRGADGDHSTRTERDGRFTLSGLAEGSYALRVTAPGYNAIGGQTVGVRAGATTELTLTLSRSSSSLATIGRVQTNGGDALSTSSAPVTVMNSQQYAAEGYTRVSDVLQNDISTTLVHPLGGNTVLPTSVALRGPDPTETLVDVDGHQVNNGNSGDFDLSLLDPADYSTIELVKGIAPSSLVGPDTIDGAINIRTLEPTVNPHGLLRFSAGSFSSFGETLQATGTEDRLGYALSLHRTTSDGEVNQTIFDQNAGQYAQVGSGFDGSTALAKLRYAFGRGGDGYAELSFHNQSQFRDLSAALTGIPPVGGSSSSSDDSIGAHALDASSGGGAPTGVQLYDGFEGTALQAHNSGYGLDVRTPIGPVDDSGVSRTSILFRHYTSLVSQSVVGPGAQTSPYLYNSRDLLGDDTLELDHQFSNSTLTFQFGVRNENLTTDYAPGVVNDESIARQIPRDLRSALTPFDSSTPSGAPTPGPQSLGLGQTQRSAVLRYTYDPTAKLHFTAATYYSNYSIFGTSLDPRFGLTYDPNSRSVVRFSVGTTYQAPQLPELYVPPVLPPAVGGYISIGNPNLKPDRATEYNLGFSTILEPGVHRTDLSVDLYRVNLRQPASTFLPPLDPKCGPVSEGGDGTMCPLSYSINAGDGVYQGIELSAQRRLGPETTLSAGYAVRSAYLTQVPEDIQDGTLVIGEQSLGLPLQKATLAVHRTPPLGFGYDAGIVYEGAYNELDQPPFALLNADVSYRFHGFELGLGATNLTNVYDQRFTREGAGVPYSGLSGPLATDAYALQGTAVTFTVTRHF